jgi:hypothetical protein
MGSWVTKPEADGEQRYPEAEGVQSQVKHERSPEEVKLPEAEGELRYLEAEGGQGQITENYRRSPGRLGPGEAEDEAAELPESFATPRLSGRYLKLSRRSPGRLEPDEAEGRQTASEDEVLAFSGSVETEGKCFSYTNDNWRIRPPEAEGDGAHYRVRMVRVRDGEQSSGSEVQFRTTVHVAPPGNSPPLPVDSHVGDICHSFAGPSGEGSEAAAAVSHSSTIGGEVGFGGGGDGATI